MFAMIETHTFPPRAQVERVMIESREAFPEPEVIARERPLDDWPAPVEKLAAHAALFGWSVKVTYAKGTLPHGSTGRPTSVKESWAVRLVRGDQRAVAVRMAGAWTSLWLWSPSQFFTRLPTLDAFYKITGTYPDLGKPGDDQGVSRAGSSAL